MQRTEGQIAKALEKHLGELGIPVMRVQHDSRVPELTVFDADGNVIRRVNLVSALQEESK